MIIHKTSVGSFTSFSKLKPLVAFIKDLLSFQVKVSVNDGFKSFWWVLDLLNHGILDVAQSYNVRIGFVLLFSLFCSLFSLEAWLIEVNVLAHGDALSRNKELEKGRQLSIPHLIW